MNKNHRFTWETRGEALPENIVQGSHWRFTALTPRLIRMEFSEDGRFENRASQVVFYRDFPTCPYDVISNNGMLMIDTEYLTVKYKENKELCEDTLQIRLKSLDVCWKYGQRMPQQLKGTARTLDEADGAIPLEDGLCSRSGYTIWDDSDQMVLTEDGWFGLRNGSLKDFYFFGYGHDYVACIQDFYRLTGVPPLLPDYALGNWWSRYHKYSQVEYCALMERFEAEKLPFSVAVVDMDWHTTEDYPEHRIDDSRFKPGWTGYTWNEELFPDYKGFLRFLKEHNLKTALNLHPAQGIGCNEAMYKDMAIACGVDPESRKLVKFDCLNPKFMETYFDILHHPYEEDGVDFWWMDWQQGTDYWWIHDEEHLPSDLEKMDPLWLLNHLHIMDISRSGKRPMFFSRYAGFGSHRYPVGFSGDTVITWESLEFQPYFTATASNAGYSWWSHDIGGHMFGYKDDELTIRWLQFGVFSPINRLHSTADPFSGKEPWNLNYEAEKIAGDWLRLRHALFPYLYTMNYRNHLQLLPMIQPMYYSHPEAEEAYEAKNQYWFGSELIVSPITEKNDPVSGRGRAQVWFPEGIWIDFFHGLIYEGDCVQNVYRPLSQMPVFAKAGAIVPMESGKEDNSLGRQEEITLMVFPGADNTFTFVEDEGDGNTEGQVATTRCEMKWGDETRLIITTEGNYDILPKQRKWKVAFRGFAKDLHISVRVNEREMDAYMSYKKNTATTMVEVEVAPVDTIDIIITGGADLKTDNSHANDKLFDLLTHAQMGNSEKLELYNNRMLLFEDKFYRVCTGESYRTVKEAMKELLMLVEDINREVEK